MATPEKIVELLRTYTMSTCIAGADLIEEQQERIAELEAERDNLERRLADSCLDERSNILDYGTPCEGAVTLQDERDELRRLSVKLYTNGYARGHHDTVEGGYTDVHHTDEDTYFAEDVAEIILESLPSPPTVKGE